MGSGPSHPSGNIHSDSIVFWLQVPNFPQVKSLLLKRPNSVNEEINNYGDTALHYCSFLGHLDMVNWLLSQGANPSKRNRDGLTPLALATQANKQDVIAVLTKAGGH